LDSALTAERKEERMDRKSEENRMKQKIFYVIDSSVDTSKNRGL
jgi:hypothetical protein